MAEKRKIVIIQGQTATGKSTLALKLAQRFNLEIINCDSMQVYEHLDIGTSKVSKKEQAKISHHLLDIVSPDEEYNASMFVNDASQKIEEITARDKLPLLVGGTGLYIRCLLGGLFNFDIDTSKQRKEINLRLEKDGLKALYDELKKVDSASAARIKPRDKQRITRALEIYNASGEKMSSLIKKHSFGDENYNCLKIGVRLEKLELLDNIKKRTDKMFDEGLLQEVETLLNKGYKDSSKALNSIGYREALAVLKKSITLAQAKERVYKRTKDYAKRQMTWFKTDGEIRWFHPSEIENIAKLIDKFIKS